MRILRRIFLTICIILTFLFPFLITGCLEKEKEALKDHNFGAFLREAANDLKTLNEALCSEQSIEKRKILIAIIRLREPLWPDDGVCHILPNPANYIEAPAVKGSLDENATA